MITGYGLRDRNIQCVRHKDFSWLHFGSKNFRQGTKNAKYDKYEE